MRVESDAERRIGTASMLDQQLVFAGAVEDDYLIVRLREQSSLDLVLGEESLCRIPSCRR